MANISHIGIIPDGNRRWALQNNMDYNKAYHKSMIHIEEFIGYTFSNNIQYLSIYMLSKENLSRQREDLNAVLEAETNFLVKQLPHIADKYDARVIHAGCISVLPTTMKDAINNITESTFNKKLHTIYLLIGYNPYDEICSAILKANGKDITNNDLWVDKNVDLVIRTAGGPTLLSNFIPLQCGYAQIYIVNKYFNDFNENEFNDIIKNAELISMPYGK